MPSPTRTDVRAVDPVLTNMLVGYQNAGDRFIADRAAPGVPVNSSKGTYFVFDKKYWFLDDFELRAWGDDYPEGGFGMSTATYETEQYAKSHSIPDETRADSQAPMDLESAGVQRLAGMLAIRKERLFATAYMATSVWDTDKTVTAKWSDYTSSDPVDDVRTGKRTISQSTGQMANVLVCGEIVEDRLLNHPDLLDRIKYTQTATFQNMRQALAAALGIDEILVGLAIYNTLNEGQTATMAPIIDDDALLMYRTPSPGLFTASAGYTFHWAPGGGMGGAYPIYYDDKKDSDVIKAKFQIDHKVVATDCGYFFSDVTD